MNVQQIEFSKVDAQAALAEYRKHRGVYDKADWEIERIYRAIARGKTVISATQAIRTAGLDEKKRPVLAICQANAALCHFTSYDGRLTFSADGRRGKFSMSMEGVTWNQARAQLPRIPPQYRPEASKLKDYWLLWEADWTAMPVDPYLLRRIGKDAFIVLAAWELTPVEIAVLRTVQ